MCDEVVWYCKTQYRKLHWLEMLYRKDDLFGRALLFSVMRKTTLLPHCHVAHRGAKKTAALYAHVKAVGTDEMYIVRRDHYGK